MRLFPSARAACLLSPRVYPQVMAEHSAGASCPAIESAREEWVCAKEDTDRSGKPRQARLPACATLLRTARAPSAGLSPCPSPRDARAGSVLLECLRRLWKPKCNASRLRQRWRKRRTKQQRGQAEARTHLAVAPPPSPALADDGSDAAGSSLPARRDRIHLSSPPFQRFLSWARSVRPDPVSFGWHADAPCCSWAW